MNNVEKCYDTKKCCDVVWSNIDTNSLGSVTVNLTQVLHLMR